MTDQGPRERLIASAITLVRERGVEATGLNELLAHSGAARRSIYQHFAGGKTELIDTSTRAAGRWIQRRLHAIEGSSPADLVAHVVEQARATLAEDFVMGCPIVAAALAPPEAGGLRATAGEVFEGWTEELTAKLRASGSTAPEARSLAGFVISSVEGALLRAQAARSTEPLDQADEQLRRLLAT